MGVLNLCMKKNPFARTFHFILLVPCVVLLIMVATSLGTFVPLHRDINDFEGSGSELDTCILFATPDRENEEVDYRGVTSCDFMIWGQLAVGALAISIGAVLIVKAFAGTKIISFFALIELILTALGFLFTLALGVVITIGTDDTCKAFEEINNLDVDTGYIPCEEFEYAGNSEIVFYGPLNTSRIVTWIEAVVVFLLFMWYGFVSIINCCLQCNCGKKAAKV